MYLVENGGGAVTFKPRAHSISERIPDHDRLDHGRHLILDSHLRMTLTNGKFNK
ncbi:MAG: hypothetical protein M2R46_02062 [Verrucomicrobia subdivision 3 bacterium]|nr:hypothetical protein [Limisphaerales bacterium]